VLLRMEFDGLIASLEGRDGGLHLPDVFLVTPLKVRGVVVVVVVAVVVDGVGRRSII
jgi:hypothetical protein